MIKIFDPPYEFKKDNELHQGDILGEDIVALDENEERPTYIGWIVLNAECDLFQRKLDYFNLAPIRQLDFIARYHYFKVEKETERRNAVKNTIANLVKGKMAKAFFFPGFFALSPDGFYADLGCIQSIMNQEIVFEENAIPLQNYLLLKRICSLNTEWKDAFSQSVGNYFFRLGLPDPYKSNFKTWLSKVTDQILQIIESD